MIKSINHKGLKLLWTKGDASKLQSENVHRILKVLNIINYLEDIPKDLKPIQNLRPHHLKGELEDFTNIHPGVILKEDVMDGNGLSLGKAAELLGVSRPYIIKDS